MCSCKTGFVLSANNKTCVGKSNVKQFCAESLNIQGCQTVTRMMLRAILARKTMAFTSVWSPQNFFLSGTGNTNA